VAGMACKLLSTLEKKLFSNFDKICD
jgi:hypothetical protein